MDALARDEKRTKISLSLPQAVVQFLDEYGAAHDHLNRSRVVELAIREFRQRQLEAELEAQYAESEPPEIQRELEDWRHIRRMARRRALDQA